MSTQDDYLLPPSMVREFGTESGDARAAEILNQLRQRNASTKSQSERISDAEQVVAEAKSNVTRYTAMLTEAREALAKAEAKLDFVKNPPSWRNVFETTHRSWGHSGEACKAAREAGYPYFVWNGWVYISTTGITTSVKEADLGS